VATGSVAGPVVTGVEGVEGATHAVPFQTSGGVQLGVVTTGAVGVATIGVTAAGGGAIGAGTAGDEGGGGGVMVTVVTGGA